MRMSSIDWGIREKIYVRFIRVKPEEPSRFGYREHTQEERSHRTITTEGRTTFGHARSHL